MRATVGGKRSVFRALCREQGGLHAVAAALLAALLGSLALRLELGLGAGGQAQRPRPAAAVGSVGA